MTRRVLGLVAALAASLLLLGGCAISPGSGLSAEEARVQLYADLDETQATIGGDWENQDDPTARGCILPLWVDGVAFPGLRIGPPPRDIAHTVNAVEEAWAAWGYHIEQTRVGDVVELQGRSSVRALIIFRASAVAMTLQGESECRPVENS